MNNNASEKYPHHATTTANDNSRPPTWQERCYFDSSPKPCAYGIHCHFDNEGDIYTDAPGVVQEFKDGCNVALPAGAVKSGPRRAPPRGGLNGAGTRGRGRRHARGGRDWSAAAVRTGLGRFSASTGPAEKSGVSDISGLRGRDAGSPEHVRAANTNSPRKRGRGSPARVAAASAQAHCPVVHPGTATRAGQQDAPAQNLPSQRAQKSHYPAQRQQPPPLPPLPPRRRVVQGFLLRVIISRAMAAVTR